MDLGVAESDDLDGDTRTRLRELWDAAFDDGFTDDDAEHAYGGVHVLAHEREHLVAHASAVPRRIKVGDRWWNAGYVEAVATHPDHRRAGIATAVMKLLQEEMTQRWQIGFLSTGATGFYARLGWERWQGPSYVLSHTGIGRTPDEDDGLMVLRYEASADVDLSASLTCEDRSGDAW